MLFGKFSMMFLVILYLKNCVCYPVVKTSSSSRTVQNIERTKSGLEFLPTKSTKKRVILTYEDLPEDGSRDEEFEMLQSLHQNSAENEHIDNAAYFEGDIKLDPLTKLYMEVDRNLPPRRKRAVIRNRNHLWRNKTVPYSIDRSLPARTKFFIRQAIRHWKGKTCLKFRRKRKNDQDFIHFYDDGEACWSQVGRFGNQQNISIVARCASKGVVVHEIGHAVGFYHEQARRDRDNYIEIVKKNIIKSDLRQFRRMGHTLVNSMGFAYDFWSIMHYSARAFSRNGKATIRIKDKYKKFGAVIGLRELSKIDIAQIREMYQCNPIPSKQSRKGCFKSSRGDGREYRGYLDYTETGITCQHWSEDYPHQHSKNLRKHGLGNHNYCRNPGGRRLRPWCFTTKKGIKWQYCDIKVCKK